MAMYEQELRDMPRGELEAIALDSVDILVLCYLDGNGGSHAREVRHEHYDACYYIAQELSARDLILDING